MKKNLIFAAVLCVALVFGFSACENPDDNEELLERIEQLENQLKDPQSGKDEDKTDSADKGGDKDNSSDNEQNGEGTPETETSTSGTENGYEWVDLGLPSGLKWATCNVGATKPEEYGKYYAWGETTTKTGSYDWSTYKWCNGSSSTLTKYCTSSSYGTVDNKTVLELADDAARANWRGAWRMPTDAEWTELRENCTWTWTTLNGKNGYEVKGAHGNSIFLPAAGYRDYDGLLGAGSNGFYWSSSLYTNGPGSAWGVIFYSDYVFGGMGIRSFGLSVRPVLGK